MFYSYVTWLVIIDICWVNNNFYSKSMNKMTFFLIRKEYKKKNCTYIKLLSRE